MLWIEGKKCFIASIALYQARIFLFLSARIFFLKHQREKPPSQKTPTGDTLSPKTPTVSGIDLNRQYIDMASLFFCRPSDFVSLSWLICYRSHALNRSTVGPLIFSTAGHTKTQKTVNFRRKYFVDFLFQTPRWGNIPDLKRINWCEIRTK